MREIAEADIALAADQLGDRIADAIEQKIGRAFFDKRDLELAQRLADDLAGPAWDVKVRTYIGRGGRQFAVLVGRFYPERRS